MSSTKIIDILNTLSFVSDYNASRSNLVTIDSYGVLSLKSTQDSSNNSTGAIIVQGGGVAINAGVNATAIDNGGALTVGGGGAFSQDVYIGGNLNISGAIISNDSVQGSNSFNYLTLTATDNSINLSTGSLITVGGISIQGNGNATSTTSGGGITVGGGAAIRKDIYVGGTANLPNVISTNISSSNSNLGNITSSTLNVTGITSENELITTSTITNLLVNNTLNANFNSNTIGSIFTTGGNVGINTTTPGYLLDINGNLRVNSNSLSIISASTLTDVLQIQNTNASGASTLQFLNNSGSSRASFGIGNNSASQFQNTVYLSTVSGIPIQLSAGGNTSFPVIINASDNSLSITSTTVSNSVSSGSLKVSGGAGINGNLYVAGGLYVNSQLAATITNTTVSSNSTTGAVLMAGGLSINILSTSDANATSYTSGGALTINGGAAISQNVYISGILDIASGSNNLNNISLQSFQFYSNSGSGAYSVIGSGNATRTTSSFTPIRFTGWNDQSNPKLTINVSTIDIINSINATNNSNTIGNLYTTGGNVGINTSAPEFTLDVSGTARITGSLTTSNIYSTNITSTNIVATNSSLATLNAGNLTTGNINFTGTLSQNGIAYLGSQWTSTAGSALSYTSGNVIISNNVSSSGLISTFASIGSLSSANIAVSGNITVGGNLLVLGSLTSVNITTVNLIDNNISAGTLNAVDTTTTNLVSTNSSLGTINSTGLTTGNINFTGNLFQNGVAYVGSQWTSTAGSALSYTSGDVIISGNVSSSGLISTTASIGNLSAGNITLSGNITVGGNLLVLGSLTSVNITTVNFVDTNITAGTLNATSATITNLTATNSSLGTINSTGLTTGNINFTGNLFQNGVSYLGSQWTTTASNLSYTSGGIVVNNLTTGNLNFTGSIYQNGILYSSSQWTTTAGNNISYTSGRVLITNENITNSSITTLNVTDLTAGNINFTGNLYQNGVLYSGSSSTGGGSSQWVNSGSNSIYFGTGANSFVSIGTTALNYALNVAGIISGTGLAITGTQNSLNSTTGQYIFNSVSISGTGESMSFTQGGALTVNGGVGVGGSIAVGGSVNYGGAASDLGGSFAALNNVSSPTDITGLLFPSVNYRSFVLNISIQITATSSLNAIYTINGIQTSSGWVISDNYDGDDTGIFFNIVSGTGQMQYTSTNQSGWVLTNLVYKATVFSISANYIPTALSNSGNSNISGSLSVGGGIISNSVDINASGTFSAANGQTVPSDITGLLLTSSIYSSFSIIMNVSLLRIAGGNLKAQYTIEGIQRDSGWNIYVTSLGDTIDLTFNILSTGQIQYSSTTTYPNFTSLTFYYNLKAFYLSGAATPLILPSGSNTVSSIQINSTNDVTSAGGAALQVAGGVNIAKNLLVGSSITAANINFTGSLYQNGSLYVGSQWNGTIGSNLSYTSGNVIMNSITTANINFTGALFQNGTPYIGSQWTSTAANLSYTSGSVVMSNASIGNLTVGNYLSVNSTFSNLNAGNVNLGMTSSYSASFIAANNIASPTAVTGLIFSNTQIRYFEVTMTVNISYNSGINNYNGIYKLNGNYTDSGWTLYTEVSGDTGATSAIAFTLNSSGQILYTSTNTVNWTSTTFRFKVDQYSLNGTYTSLFSNTQGSYILGSMQINTTQDALPNNNFGALQVLGGVTIAKGLFVGGTSFFNTAGSLGINTTNVSSTLTVNGTITTSNLGAANISTGTLNTGTFIQGNSKKYIYTGSIANTTNGNIILSFNTFNSYLYAKVAVALQETSNLQNISVLQFECSAAGNTVSAVPNFWNLGISGTSSFPWFTGVTTGSSSTAATLQFAPATTLRNYNYTLSIDLVGTGSAGLLRQDNATVNTWAY